TPDSHFMVESRYKGTKVVAVAPDYAEYVKFADTWLPVEAGMDAALGMAMTHVILKEYYVDKETPYFLDYVKKYTDLPFLITLHQDGDNLRSGKFLRAENIGMDISNAEWKSVMFDKNNKTWNLHLTDSDNEIDDIDPLLTFVHDSDDVVDVSFPEFLSSSSETFTRKVPVKKVKVDGIERYVTTVFDLLLANCGVSRGL